MGHRTVKKTHTRHSQILPNLSRAVAAGPDAAPAYNTAMQANLITADITDIGDNRTNDCDVR